MNRFRPRPDPDEVLHVLTEVVERIEVLWERSREASPAPLSASQLRAMFVLERVESLNLRALGEALDSTPPSVSRLCDRLQAVGFLERSLSPNSRREVDLRLTERGRTYLADLRARRNEHLRGLVEALPASSRSAMVEGLTRLRDAAEDENARGGQVRPDEGRGTQSA
ncbi:MarR family winged helix-turn-helix transcriptional regulator [Saccharothrix carnea]|uniref:MarR family winged helix-turn-helix transcriptional regulator n=1 Tax=Saccharothrix carnea TaxID=1280637 RepID=UPI000D0CC992|nr:MarR family transcriptional regulator [Saccharothrix carnea]